jgi:hypothetical protein
MKFKKKYGTLIGDLNERKLQKPQIIAFIILPLVTEFLSAIAVTQLHMYPTSAIIVLQFAVMIQLGIFLEKRPMYTGNKIEIFNKIM